MDTSTPDREDSRTWSGFWSGLIWFVIGYLTINVTQLVALIVMAAGETVEAGGDLSEERIAMLAVDGDVLTLGLLLTLPAFWGLIALATKGRRNQALFEFLGLRSVDSATVLRWSLYAIGLTVAIAILDTLLGRPPVPKIMLDAYSSADNLLFFCIGVAVFGPVAEELLFRGYIARVWAASRLGPTMTTVLLSLLWAGIHLQYDLYDMTWVFALGVILCLSRLQTNSIIPALIIHMGWNTVGLAVLAYYNAV